MGKLRLESIEITVALGYDEHACQLSYDSIAHKMFNISIEVNQYKKMSEIFVIHHHWLNRLLCSWSQIWIWGETSYIYNNLTIEWRQSRRVLQKKKWSPAFKAHKIVNQQIKDILHFKSMHQGHLRRPYEKSTEAAGSQTTRRFQTVQHSELYAFFFTSRTQLRFRSMTEVWSIRFEHFINMDSMVYGISLF